jgi:hypothetical protein
MKNNKLLLAFTVSWIFFVGFVSHWVDSRIEATKCEEVKK